MGEDGELVWCRRREVVAEDDVSHQKPEADEGSVPVHYGGQVPEAWR